MALKTGSAGANNGEGGNYTRKIDTVKPNVKLVFPSEKRYNRLVILPARDPAVPPHDGAWATSTFPYRDANSDNHEPDFPEATPFSGWFVNVMCQKGLGEEERERYVSPATRGGAYKDPLREAYFHCVQRGKSDDVSEKEKEAYLALRRGRDCQKLPSGVNSFSTGGSAVFLNVLVEDKDTNKWVNSLAMITDTGMHMLKKTLNEKRPFDQEHHDPDWPEFKIGDPMKPSAATVWRVKKVKTTGGSGGGIEVNTLQPTTETIQLTQEQLAGRYNLADDEHVIHIPDADEILKFLFQYGCYDPDVLLEAFTDADWVNAQKVYDELIASGWTPQEHCRIMAQVRDPFYKGWSSLKKKGDYTTAPQQEQPASQTPVQPAARPILLRPVPPKRISGGCQRMAEPLSRVHLLR